MAAGSPQKAAAVPLEHITPQTELAEILDLPCVVVQALTALGDANSMMVRVATQKKQRAVADIVGESEAEHLLEETLSLARPLGLEHRMAEPSRLNSAASVRWLVLGHA